ncbi:MAG TPA: flagellar protein FlaG [Anaerolineales bacterium]|nr:flagellar protein FlaG [Anaerolineales bacterium]
MSPKALTPVHAETPTSHEPVAVETERSKQTEAAAAQTGSASNVSIHFQLDDKTHELTLFVVDRKSKRVLRSIPASELHKLKAGDLLKLTA